TRGRRRARAAASALAGKRSPKGVEEDSSRSRAGVVSDGVVDDVHVGRIGQRDSGAIPAANVVDDDVVGDGHLVPLSWIGGEVNHVRAVDSIEGDARPSAALSSV